MTNWKLLTPSPQDLAAVRHVVSGNVFINADAEPSWTGLYLPTEGGDYLSLSWGSQDVAVRFEIFCLMIERHSSRESMRLQAVATLPAFSDLRFLLRTTWVRPAVPGEVPPHFIQRVEESGTSSSVPPDFIEAGTTLDGVMFVDGNGRPVMTISVVNSTDYVVSVSTDANTMATGMNECDVMSLDDVLSWTPPVVSRRRSQPGDTQ